EVQLEPADLAGEIELLVRMDIQFFLQMLPPVVVEIFHEGRLRGGRQGRQQENNYSLISYHRFQKISLASRKVRDSFRHARYTPGNRYNLSHSPAGRGRP